MGVDMGEGHLQPPDVNNPLGYYEDLRWQALNKRLVGLQYEHCWPDTVDDDALQQYRELAAECDRQEIWGMKDPRLCFTLHIIAPLLADPRLVVVRRRSQEGVVASLVRHSERSYHGQYRMDAEQAALLYAEWRIGLERQVAMFGGPKLEAVYEDVIDAPRYWDALLGRFAFKRLQIGPRPGAYHLVRSEMRHG